MSTADLAKTYDPAAVEAEAYRVWTDEGCFTADPAHPGPPYSIVIPPPNVTGALHLGHAINNTLQDILVRQHRMAGFNTVWIPGIDHAGIATQAVVEKQLKEKENQTRHDVGREGLVERIWAWKQQYGDRILMQLQRLGCSCDWSRTRFTLDEQCARAVRETFFKLFKDGLVYRGKRLGQLGRRPADVHQRRRDLPRDRQDVPLAHQLPHRGRRFHHEATKSRRREKRRYRFFSPFVPSWLRG